MFGESNMPKIVTGEGNKSKSKTKSKPKSKPKSSVKKQTKDVSESPKKISEVSSKKEKIMPKVVEKKNKLVKVQNRFAYPFFLDYDGSKIRIPGRGRVTAERDKLPSNLPQGITLIEMNK